MEEFQEVMKQWARMCHSFRCLPNGCNGCPLEHERCYHEMPYRMDISIIESKVMAWVAEHPELVYPSWGEYLASIGVMKPAQPDKAYEVWFTQLYSTNIPADIAQKLGIEPKEGTTWAR